MAEVNIDTLRSLLSNKFSLNYGQSRIGNYALFGKVDRGLKKAGKCVLDKIKKSS